MTYSNTGVARFTEEEKSKMVREYLPQLKTWVTRAKSGLPESVDIDELYSAAALGLIECLDKYDKTRNASFSTYVEHRVKGAILDALRGLDVLSRNARTKVKAVEKAVNGLTAKLGRAPTAEEISEETGFDEEEFFDIISLQNADKTLSLDENLGDEDGALDLVEYLQAAGLSPEDEVLKNRLVEVMAEEVDKLNEKERLVVSLYYYEELTMKEVAETLDITESRVSQIHSSAIAKMKKRLKGIL